MLGRDGAAAQMQKWYERLAPLVASARARLQEIELAALLRRSGCTLDPDGALRLSLFSRPYRIIRPEWRVQSAAEARSGEEPTEFTQALLLTYLVTADGTPPSGRWISYRDLPGGMFYARAFHGYAEDRLVRELEETGAGLGRIQAFCQSAERLGGSQIEIGEHAYAFAVLPRVHLAAAYWPGDEDFPDQTSILFEDTASHYLSTDGLAVLGSHLVHALLDALD